uniref:hypothetical protein n=1 Tax=Azospirillum argentinense TaxID=2970906 RepID=UPI001586BE9C|nr:hypothetical protein [Azospirillum argentinense]
MTDLLTAGSAELKHQDGMTELVGRIDGDRLARWGGAPRLSHGIGSNGADAEQ